MQQYEKLFAGIQASNGSSYAKRVGKLTHYMVSNYLTKATNVRLLLGDVGGWDSLYCLVFSAYATLPDPWQAADVNFRNRELILPVTNRWRKDRHKQVVSYDPTVFVQDTDKPYPSPWQHISKEDDVAEFAISQLSEPLNGSYLIVALEARAVSVSTQKFVKSLTPKELTLLNVAEQTAVFDADWDGNFVYLARKTGQTKTQVRDLLYRIVRKLAVYGDVDVAALSPQASLRWDSIVMRIGA